MEGNQQEEKNSVNHSEKSPELVSDLGDYPRHNKKKELIVKITQKAGSFLKDKYNLVFLVILILAFLIRLKYIGQESIWNDSTVHMWYSIQVINDPSFFFSSIYLSGDYFTIQTLMALIYFLTKNITLSGQVVAIGYSLVGIIFIYLIGCELKNKFVGLISAALLSFNHLFWFYNVRPLADAPLTTMVVLMLYFMVKLEKEKNIKWGILLGFSFIAALFTKGLAIIYIFALLIYYLVFKRKEMFNRSYLLSWLMPLGFVMLAELLGRLIFNAKNGYLVVVFERLVGLKGLILGFEVTKYFTWIFSWYLLVLIIIGALFVIFYKKKLYYFGMVLFLVHWVYFEFAVQSEDRYIMYVLPIGICLAAFALDEIKQYLSFIIKSNNLRQGLIIAAVVFICWNYYDLGDGLIYQKSFTYTGYQEAGEWLKSNLPENAVLFAGSPRTMRAFVEREYGGPEDTIDGSKATGTLWWLRSGRYVNNQTLFEKDLSELSKKHEVYLEIDVWEYTQPKWYFPISQNSLNYFVGLGFTPIKIVEREVPTNEGLKKMPVIFVFKKG